MAVPPLIHSLVTITTTLTYYHPIWGTTSNFSDPIHDEYQRFQKTMSTLPRTEDILVCKCVTTVAVDHLSITMPTSPIIPFILILFLADIIFYSNIK